MDSAPSRLAAIDHVAFYAADLTVTLQFYEEVLGLKPTGEPHRIDGAAAVQRIGAGGVVLSVHQAGSGAGPVARTYLPGTLDICFEWLGDIASAEAHLAGHGVAVIEGPVRRRMRDGTASQSVYFRDPDGNLLEFMARDDPGRRP